MFTKDCIDATSETNFRWSSEQKVTVNWVQNVCKNENDAVLTI